MTVGNTITNAIFCDFAVLGMLATWRYGMEQRFYWTYFTLFIIGIGSWAFHASLLYHFQLLDELPMLFCVCSLLYCTFETGDRPWMGRKLAWGLASVAGLITLSYLWLNIPQFHHVAYGSLAAVAGTRLAYLGIRDPMGRKARHILTLSLSWTIGGFILWNIDNVYCEQLRGIRSIIQQQGPRLLTSLIRSVLPTAFWTRMVEQAVWTTGLNLSWIASGVFQFHAWWHIGSGIGAYYAILYLQWYRANQGKFSIAADTQFAISADEAKKSEGYVVSYGEDADSRGKKGERKALLKLYWWAHLIPFMRVAPIIKKPHTNDEAPVSVYSTPTRKAGKRQIVQAK